MSEHEGIFIHTFKNSFIWYSKQLQDYKFKSVNYPHVAKTANKKTVCIDILNTLVVREELINHD